MAFTCIYEVGVRDHLRLIFQQQVFLIALCLVVSSSSTTPEAQQHGTISKTSEKILHFSPTCWSSSHFPNLRVSSSKKYNLSSILSSSVSERGHFCTFKYVIFCGLYPAVVAMYLPGAADNVVTSRHPSGYWIARGNGPERPCIMVHLRLASSWKFHLQVFANGVPHKKHLWD